MQTPSIQTQRQLEEQKLKITSDFKEMHKFLEEQEHVCLTELADLEKEIKERQEKNMTRLSKEISHFRELIKDVEEKCQQLPSEFLQDIRDTLSRCLEGRVRQQLKLPPESEQWRLRSASLKCSALETAMKEFQGSLEQAAGKGSLEEAAGKVSVTLDPDTANPRLVLSEDLKSVRCGTTKQNLPDNPERFDRIYCVLGCERFTSGRHYWDVEVEEKMKDGRWWLVGVARESLRRKRCSMFSPNEGIWAVGKDVFQPLVAFTSHPNTPLTLSRQPRKIRVFLDYEEGGVEFFDADTDSLIFTFPPASFSGEVIRPFFWVGFGVYLHC